MSTNSYALPQITAKLKREFSLNDKIDIHLEDRKLELMLTLGHLLRLTCEGFMVLFCVGVPYGDLVDHVQYADPDDYICSTILSQIFFCVNRIEHILHLEVDNFHDVNRDLENECLFHVLFLHYLCITINEWKRNSTTSSFICAHINVLHAQDYTLRSLPRIYAMV